MAEFSPAELRMLAAWGAAIRERDGERWSGSEDRLLGRLRAMRAQAQPRNPLWGAGAAGDMAGRSVDDPS